jgi:hypothetical protein
LLFRLLPPPPSFPFSFPVKAVFQEPAVRAPMIFKQINVKETCFWHLKILFTHKIDFYLQTIFVFLKFTFTPRQPGPGKAAFSAFLFFLTLPPETEQLPPEA